MDVSENPKQQRPSDYLRSRASRHLERVVERLPKNPLDRLLLFIEVVRFVDYRGITSAAFPENVPVHEIDLMYWGWNGAVANLFEAFDQPNAFPNMETTHKSQFYAYSLLQEFGKISLLRRLADMVDSGIMECCEEDGLLTLRTTSDASAQFVDATEQRELDRAEVFWASANSSSGWRMVNVEEMDRYKHAPGAFFSIRPKHPLKDWFRDDIDDLMRPLIKPWNTGRGVMVAYGARPEIDQHFLGEALHLATEWRALAGISPAAKLGGLTGAHFTAVAAALISLHSKHVRFCFVAAREIKGVSLAQSLSIWGAKSDLAGSLVELTGLTKAIVDQVLNVIALRPEQSKCLAQYSTPIIPLLFDMGNGLIFRPVSSLTRNPFSALKVMHEWYDRRTVNALSVDREAWMRSEIYEMFLGRRYLRVEGNVKLRRCAAPVTDIDAAILDLTSGDIAVFQLKWQDYDMNDVRKLRSKAMNLASEMDEWAGAVKAWIDEHGLTTFGQALRLNLKRRQIIRNVFLFGVSRAVVRTEGYGAKSKALNLAMASSAQFVRLRMQVGPTARAIRDLHEAILRERSRNIAASPIPVTIEIGEVRLHVADLWNKIDE